MFTGIIQDMSIVSYLEKKPGLTTLGFTFSSAMLSNLNLGASVAIDGVCLTVTSIVDAMVTFDVIQETLNKTNLATLKLNDKVNVERAAKIGDEIGGHLLSGHISGTVTITNIQHSAHNHVLRLSVPANYMDYILPKGFVALNGASLTVVDVDQSTHTFTVHLIPTTLAHTTFAIKQVGDKVNLEIDSQTQTIIATIQQFLQKSTDNI
jgi:riboflavin synthase